MEPLPAGPGTLQAQCVPWGTLQTPQEALTPQEESCCGLPSEFPPLDGHPPNGPTRPQGTTGTEGEGEALWPVAVGLCCGFGWEGG